MTRPPRCPCGNGDFEECCGPLLAGAVATTPEQLMRSRYTAFTLGKVDYLRRTWHPGTRPAELDLEPNVRWEQLEILEAPTPAADEKRAIVEFNAYYRTPGGHRAAMHERSRFVRQSGQWWYLDGKSDSNRPQ